MTPSQHRPTIVHIAPVDTPLDAGPNVWMSVGFADDFSVHYVDEEPALIPAATLSATVEVDLSWDDLLSEIRAIRYPHPVCSDTRERIEEYLQRRRIASMLQAALHSYRLTVSPISSPLASWVTLA
ncbi:hypothetical protein [Streptomyces rochei]|uniref:hypothetical protein n=1 Tax=Streptomyces rochei TaxID=1928 RepID=UPI0036F7AE1C